MKKARCIVRFITARFVRAVLVVVILGLHVQKLEKSGAIARLERGRSSHRAAQPTIEH
jgi:hypothetical protein